MRYACVAVVVIGCARTPCPVAPVIVRPTTLVTRAPRPYSIEARRCVIDYDPGGEPDALQLARIVDRATDALETEFQFLGTGALWQKTVCRVRQFSVANSSASEKGADTWIDMTDAGTAIDVHVFALSAHAKTAKTMVGEPKDERYMSKVVVHELSHWALKRARVPHAKGYAEPTMPSWVREGLPEYLGCVRTEATNRTIVLAKYIALVKGDPNYVTFAGEIATKNAYAGGAVLWAFLVENFGVEKMRMLLSSDRSTFREAFVEAYGMAPEDLAAPFATWLAK